MMAYAIYGGTALMMARAASRSVQAPRPNKQLNVVIRLQHILYLNYLNFLSKY
jgi:hypothetical protein